MAESGETRLHSLRCRFGHNVDMDDAPPEHPWLHEQLAIQESAIEGKGLFANEDLPADLVVIRLAGRLVSSSELASLIGEAKADPSAPYVDTLTIYEDVHLVLPPATKVHFRKSQL